MTLSNFIWTDKDSSRWFILRPKGHEGPFSLNILLELLEKKQISLETKIWSEGLHYPVDLGVAIERSESVFMISEDPAIESEDDLPPPIDHLVFEVTQSNGRQPWVYWTGAFLVVSMAFFFYFVNSQERFHLDRLSKMSLKLYERILLENSFSGWSKDLFFKEYTPEDHSTIWLVTSSFQTCRIEATFSSIKDRLLKLADEKIVFHSNGVLKNHYVELNTFNFQMGSRLVPGLYEMDLKAYDCSWDGFLPNLKNSFFDPPREYLARMKVILFSQGPREFNRNLENILQQKKKKEEIQKGHEIHFWEDIQQKLQTLEAITLQIEQHFLDFLENDGSFKKELPTMVNSYTRKFGAYLSSFLLESELFFKNYSSSGIAKKRDYEILMRVISKEIGLASMNFIEEFQVMKTAPSLKERKRLTLRVKEKFQRIKAELTGKLTEVERDRQDQL